MPSILLNEKVGCPIQPLFRLRNQRLRHQHLTPTFHRALAHAMVKAIVLLATGGEEIEIVTPVDVLRRAQFDVVLAGVEVNRITLH